MSALQPVRSEQSAPATKHPHRHYNPSFIETHQIADALTSRGYGHIEPVHRLTPGASVRIATHGKPPTNDAVQVSMFADAQGAYFTDHATGEEGPIWPNSAQVITSEESAKLFREAEERRRKQEAERQTLQDLRARQAQTRWRAGFSTGTHQYITTKQLSGFHNALIEEDSGALLIPMWVIGIGIVNLQLIYPDGHKRFMAGARVKGAFSVIGSLHNAERVLICEGWATGASLYEKYKSQGYQVVVAFNAGNLMPVCQSLRSRFENITVVVAGDDDRQNIVNVGRQKAIAAAESIGANLAFPELCKACTCSDHNDVAICKRRRARG